MDVRMGGNRIGSDRPNVAYAMTSEKALLPLVRRYRKRPG
jgi:hypothetical protein